MRDPSVLVWPKALAPKDISVSLERSARYGAPPISGAPQLVTSSAATWKITYKEIEFTPSTILQLRSLFARLLGALEPVYISPYDYANAPYVRSGATSPTVTTFDDSPTNLFDDGTSFDETIQDCTLAANVAEGDSTWAVTNSVLAPLSEGDYFELNGCLHLIRRIIGTSWDVTPRARAAAASGTVLEIDDPRALCILDPATPSLDTLLGRYGSINLTFWEKRW